MKRSLLLGAVSALAMIASAQAADMGGGGMKDETPPIWNWAGFYVGVNGGWIGNEGGSSTLVEERLKCSDCDGWSEYTGRNGQQLDGGFGGGQIGFNMQRDRLVYGVEFDIQGSSLSQSRNVVPLDGYSTPFSYAHADANLDWFGSIRTRLGLVPWENILVYTTGGFAFGGFRETLRHDYNWGSYLTSNNFNDTRGGYDLGAGVEYGITPAWSVKFEYQFFDLGNVHLYHQAAGVTSCDWAVASQSEANLSFNTVRIGINYHFIPEYVPLK